MARWTAGTAVAVARWPARNRVPVHPCKADRPHGQPAMAQTVGDCKELLLTEGDTAEPPWMLSLS